MYQDIIYMRQRIHAFALDEITEWIEHMGSEISHYAQRMSSMAGAAVDKAGLERIRGIATAQGLTVREAGPLRVGISGDAMAWKLICDRR